VPVELAQKSEDALLDRADSLEHLGETMKLDAVAKQFGMTARTAQLAPPISFIPGVGVPEESLPWVFDEAKVGDVSQVFESPNAYYMLQLVARTDSGTMTLDESKLNIQRTLIDNEVLRRAQEKVNAALPGKTLDDVATTFKSTIGEASSFARGDEVPGLGRLNPAIGAAFGLKPGQMSTAIPAGGRLFVIQTITKTGADRAAFEAQKAGQRIQVLQALADQKWQQYLDALHKSAKIVDNRKAIQARQTAAQNAQ
jgi:parvulin-like peptidyl-prolyl isomerase